MDKDDITRMAREAGMVVIGDKYSLLPFLEHFAALVAAAEREACAKVCEKEALLWPPSRDFTLCAAAIRARGNT